jgi:hypothetical protein
LAPPKSTDPLSKLISLDSLTKNPQKKPVNMVNQPVVANAAASQYVQNQAQIHAQVHQQSVNASFSGIDGIHSSGGMGMMNPSFGMPQNPSVMGSGGDAISSVFDPSVMKQQAQANQAGNQQMMGGNAFGMMGMNNNMGMGSSMGMNSMQPGNGGMMMPGNNMGAMGGATMQQGGMMYGNMTPQQQQQMMQQQQMIMMQQQQMMNSNQGMPGGFNMQSNMNHGGFR